MSEEDLSHDRIDDLMASRRRRYVLYCLYLYANPMRLPDVADQVCEWEHGRPRDELLDERLHIYTSLYHNHIPKLADPDVIAYSQSEDMVELDENAAQLRSYLERTVAADLETTEVSTALQPPHS